MKRRDFLKTAAIGSSMPAPSLAIPSLSLAADAKTLRFVPQANLANFDPVWTTQYVVRNASLLVWEMLYGVDANLVPQPQMAESHEVTDDFKTWTVRMRPDL